MDTLIGGILTLLGLDIESMNVVIAYIITDHGITLWLKLKMVVYDTDVHVNYKKKIRKHQVPAPCPQQNK